MELEEFNKEYASIRDIKEPYRSVLRILEDFYSEGPQGCEKLSFDFSDYYAMIAVANICDTMILNPLVYIQVLKNACGFYSPHTQRMNSLDNFSVPFSKEMVCILSGVYYVMAMEEHLDDHQLMRTEQFIVGRYPKDAPYFYVFKNAAEEYKKTHAEEKKEIEKNDDKRLTPIQSSLFCEALLDYLDYHYTNKKETISPMASKMFGWRVSTIEKRVHEGYTQEDRDYVADIFKGTALEEKIRNAGKKEVKVNPPKREPKSEKKENQGIILGEPFPKSWGTNPQKKETL